MVLINPDQTTTYALYPYKTVTFGAATNIDVPLGTLPAVYASFRKIWDLTNYGSIYGNTDVFFDGGGTFLNYGKLKNVNSADTCVYFANNWGTVTNAGSMTSASKSAIKLAEGGVIVNQAGGTIFGNVFAGNEGNSITNAGLISITASHCSAIDMDGGGSVVNSGIVLISSAAYATGVAAYISYESGTATVTNSGTISGSAAHESGIKTAGSYLGPDGTVVGTAINTGSIKLSTTQHVAGILMENGGAVQNTGLISVYASLYHAVGVQLADGGALTNSGTITTTTTPQKASGVDLMNGGTVTNLAGGSIVSAGHVAIYASGTTGVSITNAGTLSGKYSVDLTNSASSSAYGFTNILTLESGSQLIGMALGSKSKWVTNDLVLTGSGTASNVFAGFQTLTVASRAIWTLSAVDQIGATSVQGTLTIASTGSLSGSTTIKGGTAIFESAYDQTVTFNGAGELELNARDTAGIYKVAGGDKIDLLDLAYVSGDKAGALLNHVLTLETAANKALATLTLDSASYAHVTVGSDNAGHVLLTFS